MEKQDLQNVSVFKGTVCKNQNCYLTATPVAVKSTKVRALLLELVLVLALHRHEGASLNTVRRHTSANNSVAGGNRGDTGVLVGDDNVSLCGAPSLHKTRETSVGLEELQQLFLHKRPLNIH